MKTTTLKKQKISWIWLLLGIFIAKEFLWSYLTPPWQAPDEIAHFGYVESLFYEHAFPILGQTFLSERVQAIGPVAPADQLQNNPLTGRLQNLNSDYQPSQDYNWIAQHPPLYYLALEPIYALLPHENPILCIFILRIFSLLLGCVTLFYADKTLKILLPKNELTQKTIVIAIAFLPMFSSISAVMNNDNLVFALAGILTYLSVKNFDEHDTKGSLLMGVLLGLLALTKATSLPLFLSIFILEIIKHLRLRLQKKHDDPKCFLKHQLAIFGPAFLIAGWWYTRNILLYHMFLPDIGTLAVNQPSMLQIDPKLATIFPEATGIIALPNATWWGFLVEKNFFLEYAKNIWGAFGQFFFHLFHWQYVIVALITLASVCGYIKIFFEQVKSVVKQNVLQNIQKNFQQILSWKGWTMILPFSIICAAVTYQLFQIYRERGFLGAMQGRYIFSALLALMYFLIKGIQNLVPKKYLPMILVMVMTFFILNDFTAVIYRIIPEFF